MNTRIDNYPCIPQVTLRLALLLIRIYITYRPLWGPPDAIYFRDPSSFSLITNGLQSGAKAVASSVGRCGCHDSFPIYKALKLPKKNYGIPNTLC